MKDYSILKEIYANNHNSERIYRNKSCQNMVYTDGVMDFLEVFDAHWIIDNVINFMPEVLKTLEKTKDTLYDVQIVLQQDNSGFMEVYRKGYVDKVYHKHISVFKQIIPFIDLPTKPNTKITRYKFYLVLSKYEPIIFTLRLPSEQ